MMRLILILSLASAAWGADYDTTRSVPANTIVEFDLDGPCVIVPSADLNGDGVTDAADVPIYARVSNWTLAELPQYVGVFYSGTRSQIVLTESVNGEVVPTIRRHLILVRGGEPGPVDPDPVDPIEPDVPETKYGIGPQVGAAFKACPPDARARMLTAFTAARDNAKAISQTLQQIDQSLATAAGKDTATREAYNTVYLPRFRELRSSGVLVSLKDDYSACWDEIIEWWDGE